MVVAGGKLMRKSDKNHPATSGTLMEWCISDWFQLSCNSLRTFIKAMRNFGAIHVADNITGVTTID